MSKRILALDAAGRLLGQFGDMEDGHLWAHRETRAAGDGRRVEMFDPVTRVSVIVDALSCRRVSWGVFRDDNIACPEASSAPSHSEFRGPWPQAMRQNHDRIACGPLELPAPRSQHRPGPPASR
ncbi:hypothetical protein [Frankia sp. Cr1]|uniref:hypothetical protein n=1 Tax=Frankia sp. Cr1 TaxID=3073931 RepID=UPI002AD5A09A|nr:hypothetical protein [Frankia sp. Cr1]